MSKTISDQKSAARKLTDAQLSIMREALQRDDRCVSPTSSLRGAKVAKTGEKLIASGLAREVKARGSGRVRSTLDALARNQLTTGGIPHAEAAATAASLVEAIEKVTLGRTQLEIVLSALDDDEETTSTIVVPWKSAAFRRRRDIIQPTAPNTSPKRAMRARAREVFAGAIVDAHRWLDELLSDPTASIAALADRERKSERSIRMTLSLAFLAPNVVKAAIDGKLPRGFNTTRLVDLPMLWPEQWLALDLERPTDDLRT